MPLGKTLVGKKFGRLTVIEGLGVRKAHNKRQTWWRCECECGNTHDVGRNNLISGQCKSCGCLKRDVCRSVNVTHGHTTQKGMTKEYKAWAHMKKRKGAAYEEVEVYAGWLDDFEAFYAHIGPCPNPKYTLDRINPWRGYEPGNVRWADRKTQATNQKRMVANRYFIPILKALKRRGILDEVLVEVGAK